MKDIRIINLKTNEETTAYKIGLEIVMDRIEEMNSQGEDANLSSLPKNERLQVGLNYIKDNENYQIIE